MLSQRIIIKLNNINIRNNIDFFIVKSSEYNGMSRCHGDRMVAVTTNGMKITKIQSTENTERTEMPCRRGDILLSLWLWIMKSKWWKTWNGSGDSVICGKTKIPYACSCFKWSLDVKFHRNIFSKNKKMNDSSMERYDRLPFLIFSSSSQRA